MFKRFATTLVVISILLFAWYFQAIQPVSPRGSAIVDFEIKTGSGLKTIASDLSDARLIRSRTAFLLTVKRLGLDKSLQAGYFKLSPSMNAGQIAQALTRAYAKQTTVTIPEGLRKEEINLIFEKAFQSKDNNYNPTEFANLTRDKEGRLFPDTYDFVPEASASDVVKRLTTQFDRVVKELNISEDSLKNVLILASLLEREAANEKEMPQVAGVLIKRLESGWPLQVDATVQYALGSSKCKELDCQWWKQNLTRQDIQFNSPYNTYQNPGLPPAPISNPGRAALAAAALPMKSTAWFYIHDLNGVIHFADTIEEHNQNICVYLKKDCQ